MVLFRAFVAVLCLPASYAFGASVGGSEGLAFGILLLVVGLMCGSLVERCFFVRAEPRPDAQRECPRVAFTGEPNPPLPAARRLSSRHRGGLAERISRLADDHRTPEGERAAAREALRRIDREDV